MSQVRGGQAEGAGRTAEPPAPGPAASHVLVLRGGGAGPVSTEEVLATLAEAGHPVSVGVHGVDAPQVPDGAHVLSSQHVPSTGHRAVLRVVDQWGAATDQLRRAARFDPWVRDTARASALALLLDEDADVLADYLPAVAPQLRVLTSAQVADFLGRERAWIDLVRVREEIAQVETARRPRLDRAFAAIASVQGTERAAAADPGWAEDLLDRAIRFGGPGILRGWVDQLTGYAGLTAEHPLIRGARILADLTDTGQTADDPAQVAGEILALADTALETALDTERDTAEPVGSRDRAWDRVARRAALGLEVAFHRRCFGGADRHPLLEDPEAYLAPLRETRTWHLLTRQAPAATPPEHTPRSVVVNLGIGRRSAAPMTRALTALPPSQVRQVRIEGEHPHLSGMAMKSEVVAFRLAHAAHRERVEQETADHPAADHPTSGEATAGEEAPGEVTAGPAPAVADPFGVDLTLDADVLVLDLAGKGALWATLQVPAPARFVLRVHDADLLRPWLYLLDWSRVTAVVCPAPHVAAYLRAALGERVAHVEIVPLPPPLEQPSHAPTAEQPPAPRPSRDTHTIAVIGWADRVRDPLWAVEVLAALRAEDPRWRLLLVGPSYASGAPAGDEEAFTARIEDPDVAGAVEVHEPSAEQEVLARAGVVLSPGLREGFPVEVARGALAGAVPVVRNWPQVASRGGARGTVPAEWVADTVDDAVTRIRETVPAEARSRAVAAAGAWATRIGDPAELTRSWQRIVFGRAASDLVHVTYAGEHQIAVRAARRILAEQTDDPVLLELAASAAHLSGHPTLRLELMHRQQLLEPENQGLARRVRSQEGALRELTPGWLPPVPEPGPQDPPDTRLDPWLGAPGTSGLRVLHVLKTSLPDRQSGYTVRSGSLLHAQRAGGTDVVVMTPPETAERADRDGADPVLQWTRGDTTHWVELVDDIPHIRTDRHRPPRNEPADDELTAWAAALWEVARAVRPDVLHAHSGHRGYESALVTRAVAERLGIPWVYEVRGLFEALWTSDVTKAEDSEVYALRRETERACMTAADHVVTLGEAMRQDIIDRGIDPDRVTIMPNGIDPAVMRPRERSPELAEQWGLTGRFVFGYVSNLDHSREGQELLVQVAALLRDRGIPATALLVGDGRRRGVIEEAIETYAAQDCVVLTGRVPHAQVADYFALCDVFVVPRRDERAARLITPLKPYEAMALGVPVVVSDLPALQEMIGDGQRGRSFAVDDVAGLADVLQELRSEEATRRDLAERAREWVLEHRAWDRLAQGYDEVYRRARARAAERED